MDFSQLHYADGSTLLKVALGGGGTNRKSMRLQFRALSPGTVGAYAFAVLCAGVAAVLQVMIDPHVLGIPFIAFFLAVIITALISGFCAGVFCTMLSAAVAAFFLLPPVQSFYIERSADVIHLSLFVLVALSLVTYIAVIRLVLEP